MSARIPSQTARHACQQRGPKDVYHLQYVRSFSVILAASQLLSRHKARLLVAIVPPFIYIEPSYGGNTPLLYAVTATNMRGWFRTTH